MTVHLFELEDAEREAQEKVEAAKLVERDAERALEAAEAALNAAREARHAATQALTDALDAIEGGAATGCAQATP
jgi:hypothetical protein